MIGNDLVLEQYLLPASPQLAGFRLDGFSAIRPRVTHSPSSDVNIWDMSSPFLEDRYISPAVLYIQVSVFQVLTKPILLYCLVILVVYYIYLLFCSDSLDVVSVTPTNNQLCNADHLCTGVIVFFTLA